MNEAANHQLSADRIRGDFDPQRVGRRLTILNEVDSTNTYVLNEARRFGRLADGFVAFSEKQSAGRGRLGRVWDCPAGAGLLMSILLVERTAELSAAAWMMLAGVVAVEAIEDATDVDVSLRWPNDLYVGNKKLGGILVEGRTLDAEQAALAIGIGINCLQHSAHFPPEIRERAVSLDMLTETPVERERIARRLLERFDAALIANEHRDETKLAEHWRTHSADIGAHVQLRYQNEVYSGHIVDVHPRDGLLLQLDDGGRRMFDPVFTSREA